MKLPVLLQICACIATAWSKSEPATTRDSKHKPNKHNSVSTTPKPEAAYQTIQQPQLEHGFQPLPPQFQRPLNVHQVQHAVVVPQHQYQQVQYQQQVQTPVAHLVQKAYYIPPQHPGQPAAMILIGQPAYVPAVGVVHGGATQQLLNYFHGNPQARYQLLHGNYQPQQVIQPASPVVQQPASTLGNYALAVPTPYHPNIVAVQAQRPPPAHVAQVVTPQIPQETQNQPTPFQLAEIAQIAAQQYSRFAPHPQSEASHAPQPQQHAQYQQEGRALPAAQAQAQPVRSLPPIFTGFENFSPEQQEKIKAQLSAHFGAPLRALAADKLPQGLVQGGQYSLKYPAHQGGEATDEYLGGSRAVKMVRVARGNGQ